MGTGNNTAMVEFTLLGLSEHTALCAILFLVFLRIYVHNHVDHHLHTPMYLFLCHLAFVDIGYSSSVTPIMLMSFLRKETSLPVAGCVAQLCSVLTFGTAECFLLAVMAYDRYVAICSPLLYSTRMSPRGCIILVGMSYLGGCMNAWTFIGFNHFFCDYSPHLKLACSHDFTVEIIPAISSGSIVVATVCVIAISYIYILITILKMRSTEGRHKAFSTCTSHLTAVTLFYGTITFIYVMPKSSYSTDQNKVVSVFYTVVIPILNPLICSLRNKEIKGALKRELRIKIFP
uniref:Olfactory receptor n=1 Tax=Macaca nemestrina TaxID=9545 RepID=A0A2K6DCV0_MACNE